MDFLRRACNHVMPLPPTIQTARADVRSNSLPRHHSLVQNLFPKEVYLPFSFVANLSPSEVKVLSSSSLRMVAVRIPHSKNAATAGTGNRLLAPVAPLKASPTVIAVRGRIVYY